MKTCAEWHTWAMAQPKDRTPPPTTTVMMWAVAVRQVPAWDLNHCMCAQDQLGQSGWHVLLDAFHNRMFLTDTLHAVMTRRPWKDLFRLHTVSQLTVAPRISAVVVAVKDILRRCSIDTCSRALRSYGCRSTRYIRRRSLGLHFASAYKSIGKAASN